MEWIESDGARSAARSVMQLALAISFLPRRGAADAESVRAALCYDGKGRPYLAVPLTDEERWDIEAMIGAIDAADTLR